MTIQCHEGCTERVLKSVQPLVFPPHLLIPYPHAESIEVKDIGRKARALRSRSALSTFKQWRFPTIFRCIFVVIIVVVVAAFL
jgi:hypothetical protein